MNLGKYIRDLLLENETVIIPGFGAFISVYQPAEINEESGEISPPSKTITFNPQIRNNDGLLIGYVAEMEGVSHFDALKKIEREREEYLYQLDKGEKITLENTGILWYNETNEIVFSAFTEDNLLLDSFGLESVSLTFHPEEETKEAEPMAEPEEISAEPASEVFETSVATEAEQTANEPEPETTEPLSEPVLETVPETAQLAAVPVKKEKSRWWFSLLLIPVILAGLYFLFPKTSTPTLPDNSTENQEVLVTPPVQAVDSTMDSGPGDSLSVVDVTPGEIAAFADSLRFVLVGGSFKDEENAENYLQQLKLEGYEPFHIGKRGNFYIVGIGKFRTEQEAITASREYSKKNPEAGFWIMKLKLK